MDMWRMGSVVFAFKVDAETECLWLAMLISEARLDGGAQMSPASPPMWLRRMAL